MKKNILLLLQQSGVVDHFEGGQVKLGAPLQACHEGGSVPIFNIMKTFGE